MKEETGMMHQRVHLRLDTISGMMHARRADGHHQQPQQ